MRRVDALGFGLGVTTALMGACGGDVEDRPADETSPAVVRPASPAASAAAEIIIGKVVNTQNAEGDEIGTYTYPSPYSDEANGSLGAGSIVGVICETEARPGRDYDVPSSPEPLEWTTWVLVADEYEIVRNGQQWFPRPFFDPNEPHEQLPPCPPSLITP